MSDKHLASESAAEQVGGVKPLPFNTEDTLRDMSFTLKTTHEVHPVTLKCILDQFRAEVKATEEDEALDRSFAAFTRRFLDRALAKLKREDSPGYKALVAYLKDKNMYPETERVSGPTQPLSAPNDPVITVAEVAGSTAEATAEVFREEAVSSIHSRLPNILDLELDEAIRTFFPSISELVLQAVRLKIMQGPTQEEAGTLNWQEAYFNDLVSRFPALAEDLAKLGVPAGSAARLLFGRGHQEANRAESARLSRRGKLNTLVGVDVDAVKLAIATERVLAGLPLEKNEGVSAEDTPASAQASSGAEFSVPETPQDIAANDEVPGDIHERVTAIPPAPAPTVAPPAEKEPAPVGVPASERETVTNEAAAEQRPVRDALTTVVGMDASLVEAEAARARAASRQEQPKPATDAPPKQKKRRGRFARLFLGDDEKEGGEK